MLFFGASFKGRYHSLIVWARITTIVLTAPHFTPRIPLPCAFGLGIPHSAVLSNMELFARDLFHPPQNGREHISRPA